MNNDDRNKLFTNHMGLAVKVALKFKKKILIRNMNLDDLIQESYKFLWEATLSFNPEKAKFSTYAYQAIYNDFLNLFEGAKHKTNKYDRLSLPKEPNLNIFPHEKEMDSLVEAVGYFKLLNNKDRDIVINWLSGDSFREMADKSTSRNPDHKKSGHYHHRFNKILKMLKSGEYREAI